MLDPALVVQELRTETFGRVLHVHERLDSTNRLARDLGREGAPPGATIVAEEQTAGRGRGDHRWVAPAGTALLFTVIVDPACPMSRLPIVAAVAMRRALCMWAPCELKWPNDLLLAGRKVGGILIETVAGPTGALRTCLGIGVNVTVDVAALPELRDSAASLHHCAMEPPVRERALAQALNHLEETYLAACTGAWDAVFAEWREHLVTLGSLVRRVGLAGPVAGLAEDVAPDGALLVRQADGSILRIVAGAIEPL